MKKSSSSGQSRRNRGGQGHSRGEDQRGQPESTMSVSSAEDNRDHLATIAAQALSISEHPTSDHRVPHVSDAQPQYGSGQDPRNPVSHQLHHDAHHQAAPPTSQAGARMVVGNLANANEDTLHHITNATRNMSITPTPAQAPLGVGPGIGSHVGQHLTASLPASLPAQARPNPRRDARLPRGPCHGCIEKNEHCNRKQPCSNCVKHKRVTKCKYPRESRSRFPRPPCSQCNTLKNCNNYKCNRELPRCSRCAKNDLECIYPGGSQPAENDPQPTKSREGLIGQDDIVANVRIRRHDGSEDVIYTHAPPGVNPPSVTQDMIIGWDGIRGGWVTRQPDQGNQLPGELGRNDYGEFAYAHNEHEGSGEMGASMDVTGAATARGHATGHRGYVQTSPRPSKQSHGYDVPGHGAHGHTARRPAELEAVDGLTIMSGRFGGPGHGVHGQAAQGSSELEVADVLTTMSGRFGGPGHGVHGQAAQESSELEAADVLTTMSGRFGIPGPSAAGSMHRRGSNESPPAQDASKRQRQR